MSSEMQDKKSNRSSEDHLGGTSRRDFLKFAAVTAAAAGVGPLAAPRANPNENRAYGLFNSLPGRIVNYRNTEINGHTATIDSAVVESSVAKGIQLLTGIEDTGLAFKSLFPGLTSTSTIAIKVNCIGVTDTRWETVAGILAGLAQMPVGTSELYDISQVVVYDRHNLGAHGYTTERFTFNGNVPVISSSNNYNPSYYVYGSHRLSDFLLTSDYLINMPVLKSHYDSNNMITTALKNHYGSCYPASLCGNITGMLSVNKDANVKDKTCLVLMDAIRGTFDGGPGGAPMDWNLFEESTPNTLYFSTDPVTNEYWARDLINTERISDGPHHSPYSEKTCPWVETSAAAPYELGVCDPEAMTVINYDSAGVDDISPAQHSNLRFTQAAPNPFVTSTRLRFYLAQPAAARMVITDVTGRTVRNLGEIAFPAGESEFSWDGRDDSGRRSAAGIYFANVHAMGERRIKRVMLTN